MSGHHPIVDALAARPPWEPARLTRALARLSGTIRSVSATIDPTERRWHELVAQSLATAEGDHRPPLWVVLGDSTAQGIGASSIDHGWVSRLHAALHGAGRPHAIVNLSRSGAHSTHVIGEQLPLLDHLPYAASIVTICVGGNDLVANPYAPGSPVDSSVWPKPLLAARSCARCRHRRSVPPPDTSTEPFGELPPNTDISSPNWGPTCSHPTGGCQPIATTPTTVAGDVGTSLRRAHGHRP